MNKHDSTLFTLQDFYTDKSTKGSHPWPHTKLPLGTTKSILALDTDRPLSSLITSHYLTSRALSIDPFATQIQKQDYQEHQNHVGQQSVSGLNNLNHPPNQLSASSTFPTNRPRSPAHHPPNNHHCFSTQAPEEAT